MLIKIKSCITGNVLHTIEADSYKLAIESLVRQRANLYRANLSGANLYGADLSGADLSGAKIDDLLCLSELSDAIDLAPLIWQEWEEKGFDAAKSRFGLYQVPGEDKALIAMAPRLIGGFCFVLHRREIWWWNWRCPNPENVPVLWRENPK